MNFRPFVESKKISQIKFKYCPKLIEQKNLKLQRIANDFFSTIFKSVIVNYNKENEVSCNHVSLLRKEENNKIIFSNFVNSLFKEAKNKCLNSKIKIGNSSNEKNNKNHKSFFISSNKKKY